MSELEKNFYDYFMSEYFNPKAPGKIAKDLAEIAETEYSRFITDNSAMKSIIESNSKDIGMLKLFNHNLQKENEEIREINKAQVLENAKLRIDITELKKQLRKLEVENEMLKLTIEKIRPELQIYPYISTTAKVGEEDDK